MLTLEKSDVWERYRNVVASYIRSIFSGKDFLSQKALYHLGFLDEQGRELEIPLTGKTVRSALLLLTVASLGKTDWKDALPAAAALELFHNATLVIDDWQDNDYTRRGRKALWTMEDVGPRQAVNVGMFLLVKSTQILAELSHGTFSPDVRERIQQLFEQTKISVIQGQHEDIAFEDRITVGVDEYLEMIWKKTGELVQTAIGMGALLGKADEQTCSYLEQFGKALGCLFQMQDDYLGVYGIAEKTGKPAEDIKHKKKSLPVILAFSKAQEEEKELLVAIYASSEHELSSHQVTIVQDIFTRLKISEALRAMIDDQYKQARTIIAQIPDGILENKNDFYHIAELFAYRDK